MQLFGTPWTIAHLYPRDSQGKNTGVGCHFLLQGIFQTQGSNQGLLHCRQTLYQLNHQGSPGMPFSSVLLRYLNFLPLGGTLAPLDRAFLALNLASQETQRLRLRLQPQSVKSAHLINEVDDQNLSLLSGKVLLSLFQLCSEHRNYQKIPCSSGYRKLPIPPFQIEGRWPRMFQAVAGRAFRQQSLEWTAYEDEAK